MENQEYFFDNYKVGESNRVGEKIRKIYARSKGKYVIYSCEDMDDICFDGSEESISNYTRISDHIAKLNSIFYSEKGRYPFITDQILYAIVEAAEGNFQKSTNILDKLENKILISKKREGRVSYLIGALIPVALNLFISLIFILIHDLILNEFWKECIYLFYVITAGSLGGFLSISINVNKLDIDSDAGRKNNTISGLIRIIISMICSLFIYFVIKSNLFLSIINQPTSKYAIIAFAMVAGFSETIVPNIISKLEKDSSNSGTSLSG